MYYSIHETVASFVSSTIKRHRTIFGKIKIKQKIHSLDDILVVINVNNQRILRNNANLVEQINNYDMLWLVTEFEWKQFTQENLEVNFLTYSFKSFAYLLIQGSFANKTWQKGYTITSKCFIT